MIASAKRYLGRTARRFGSLFVLAAACAPRTTTTPAEAVTPALPPPIADLAPPPGGTAGAGAGTEGPSAESSPAPADSAATAPPPAETAPPAPAGPERRGSAVDLLTQSDLAFLVDYASSGARTTAEEKCEQESQGDAEKRAACMTKARDLFTADVLRFVKEAGGRTTFKIYKRKGSSLAEVYVGPVELAEESPTSVRMRFKSAGKGARPLFRAQKDAVVDVPNEYSIELADPELGKLMYSAKVGLVSD